MLYLPAQMCGDRSVPGTAEVLVKAYYAGQETMLYPHIISR